MTMPEPVSPPDPRRTSMETTLGRILAATAAVAPAARCDEVTGCAGPPRLTVSGDEPLPVEPVLWAMTPPMVPPKMAVTALTSASMAQLGGELRHEPPGSRGASRSLADAGGGVHHGPGSVSWLGGCDHASPRSVMCPLCADSVTRLVADRGGRHQRRRRGEDRQAGEGLHRGMGR